MKRVFLCGALLVAFVAAAAGLVAVFLTTDGDSANRTSSTTLPASGNPQTSTAAQQTTQVEQIEGSYQTIPQDQAKAEMDALSKEGKPFILLDVRRQDEYNESHIAGALLLPNELIGTTRPSELPDLNTPIYVYCRSGNRSLQAARKLAAMGYTVYDFGGIIDWPYDTVKG